MRRWTASLLAVVALLGADGCSSSQEPAVRTTAAAFQRAVAAQDTGAACALLSDAARDQLVSHDAPGVPAGPGRARAAR